MREARPDVAAPPAVTRVVSREAGCVLLTLRSDAQQWITRGGRCVMVMWAEEEEGE